VDRIELNGMSFWGRHGVRDAERAEAQEFRVDMEIGADLEQAGSSDRLGDTVDYTKLRAIAREVIEGPSAHLLESLAHEIAVRALEVPRVQTVTVRIAKRPASMQPIDAAAVRIERGRA